MNYYVSIFENSKIGTVARYGAAGPGPEGSVMSATFVLAGQEFLALNGGPAFKFTPAISFFITCHTQDEVDELWMKLSDGGRTDRCGWLQDKFGLSWQVVPDVMIELLKDPAKAGKVMAAFMPMKKIDIATLQRAAESRPTR